MTLGDNYPRWIDQSRSTLELIVLAKFNEPVIKGLLTKGIDEEMEKLRPHLVAPVDSLSNFFTLGAAMIQLRDMLIIVG